MSELAAWVGEEHVERDVLTLFPARAMAALLDRPPEQIEPGAALPAGWHWLYFRPLPRSSALGPDGHEKRGAFLPPVELPRRMWAGGRLTFSKRLRLGDSVVRRSSIESVVEKEGRSGRLTFVTVRHRIETEQGALALDEEQHLVYAEGKGGGRSQTAQRVPEEGDWSETVSLDPVSLFRFSAITFNGHRIHYDHRYATGEEGYPDLVVHAPLTALLLLGAGARRLSGPPGRFSYRASSPLFANEAIRISGVPAPEGAGLSLSAAAPDGSLAMRATLEPSRDDSLAIEGLAPAGGL